MSTATANRSGETETRQGSRISHLLVAGFVRLGALPPLLIITLIVFSLMSDNFLTVDNLHTALRQNSYVIIATLAQFVVLLAGGFDLSVGAITALVSVSTAMAVAGQDGSAAGAVFVGILVGLGVGLAAGTVNAVGVGWLKVNPFIMTLATASIFQGLALMLTSGVPVYGMPREFSEWFGFKKLLGIGVSIWIALAVAVLLWVLLVWTRPGRHIYAVGSSPHAARLSGVHEGRTLFLAYALAGLLAAIGAVLLTARLETGEANIGASLPLETIAAAVIGGVSLRGGSGSVINAVLGAVFIGLVGNGLNLAQVTSHYQMIVLGVVLAFAVIADRFRQRMQAAVLAGRV
jgi:ribose/xylose/arabinose/galactoside ABC-type transport system permease subunit